MNLSNRKLRFSSATSRRDKSMESQPQKKTIHKQLRFQSNESLNEIKNDIHNTFSNENKRLNYIKQLTSDINPKYKKRIDRMCVQYSICQKPRAFKTPSEDIDTQYIAKTYIRKKSKERQKQQEMQQLRKSVKKMANRYIQQKPYLFFNFQLDKLRQMQKKTKKDKDNNISNSKQHPYLNIYQSSQQQVINNLIKNKCLSLGQVDDIPPFGQPDQWQKDRKHIKGIYAGVKNLRVQTARQRPAMKSNSINDTFYIT